MTPHCEAQKQQENSRGLGMVHKLTAHYRRQLDMALQHIAAGFNIITSIQMFGTDAR